MKRPLRFGSFVAVMSLGCETIDIGDFAEGTTSGPSDGSSGGTGDDGQSSATEASADGAGTTSDGAGTTSGGATAVTAATAEGGIGVGTTGGGADVLCDPLLQDCAEGDTCVWEDETFRCLSHVSVTQSGEVCESTNGCDVGLQCIDPESIGCSAADPGCCSSFCDSSDPVAEICGPGRVCIAWFPVGAAPPGLEDVGVCRIDLAGGSDSEGEVPPQCDAVAQDCAAGDACVLDDDFVCLPEGDASLGDACTTVNDCQMALVCAAWDVVPGCAEANGACCAQLCSPSGPVCDDGLTCSELPGGPFAGNEDVGYCTL